MEHFHQPSAPCPPLKRSCSQQAIPNLPVVLEKKLEEPQSLKLAIHTLLLPFSI